MKYQDYVIKDGKFIGDFEGLYENFEDPWFQNIREKTSSEKIVGLEILKKNGHISPIELGCGHGHYTKRIKDYVGFCTGVDISMTAINKSKNLYPDCKFIVSDVLNEDIFTSEIDCIMMVEITWYVLDKLNNFKKLLKEKYSGKNVGFFHTLNVYSEGEQKYGNDFFTNNLEIMNYFSDLVDIEEYGEFGKKDYNGGKRTFFYGKIK